MSSGGEPNEGSPRSKQDLRLEGDAGTLHRRRPKGARGRGGTDDTRKFRDIISRVNVGVF